MSFTEAVTDSGGPSTHRHLLMGNGFSIACRPKLFSYGALLQEAEFPELGVRPERLFEALGTSDFERVVAGLRTTSTLMELYPSHSATLLAAIDADAEAVKETLASVLSAKHPDNVGAIDADEYRSARQFLAHFGGKLFTVNYDLLLYWTLLQDMQPELQTNDGFGNDPDDAEADWVVWNGYADFRQRVYHLHGGLHLYDAGASLRKLTWTRTSVALIDQIRGAMAQGSLPLVVTEGTSEDKLRRIEHSPYLHRGLKSLSQCQHSLFIYGHSLADNDAHILRRIEEGRFSKVYVAVHGDTSTDANARLAHRADLLRDRRARVEAERSGASPRPLEVSFFDSESAAVWRPA